VPCGVVQRVDQAWRYAPQRTFAASGLHYEAHGIDGVCLDPAAFALVGGLAVISRHETGSDHDWVTVTVRSGAGVVSGP
jgi:hypothetical protein